MTKAAIEHKATNAASKIRSLLQLREQADAEIAKILTEEKEKRGVEDWLVWCEKEFGWGRRQAYVRLDPNGTTKDRVRKSAQMDEEDDLEGPTFKLGPLNQALSDLVRETRRRPVAGEIESMQKQYDSGTGFDVALLDELVRARDWLNELIRGIEPLIVSCAVNSNGKGH